MPQLELAGLHLAGQHLQTLQSLLQAHVPTAQVWVYGSRVTGGAHEGSDLDIVLREPTDLAQDPGGWSELKEALEASNLPMLCEIHLWPRLPKAFHANIKAAYVELQSPLPSLQNR